MPTRKNMGDSTEPIIDFGRAIKIGLIVAIVGAFIAFLLGSGALIASCILAGIGIIFLGIGNEIIHRVALCLFGIALILLGVALCPLLD